MNKLIITPKAEQDLYHHFEKFIRLSENLKAELSQRIKPVLFQKGELVLDADRISTESYFINTGILRTYYLKDGKEISEYFCEAHERVNSPKSFRLQELDIHYIDATEETETYSINVHEPSLSF